MSRRLIAVLAGTGLLLAACDAAGQLDPGQLDPGLLTADGTIRATDIAFEPVAITLRAGVPVTITLDNADGVPHGLVIMQGATQLAASELITGPGRTTVEVPPLAPGGYEFGCPVHPNMQGTITVEP